MLTKLLPLNTHKVSAISAIIGAVTVASVTLTVPAMAKSTSELLEMCVVAMDETKLASSQDYRAKLKKSRGGALKKLTIELVPVNGDGESKTVVCQVRRGNVVDVADKN